MTAHDPSIAAADPRRSAWVAANAGSGKTYTLANRVTRLLLAKAKPERILCLTYTKAAAAEMQARLFSQLGELAMLPDDALAKKLKEICGEALKPSEWPEARRLFAQALETPGGLKIQTLHGFCQSVLARFPLEAGIPPGFRVLDEQTSATMIADARERILDRAGSGADTMLAGALSLLATQMSETRLAEVLRNCLGTDRRKIDRFLQTIPGVDELQDTIWRAHELERGETPGAIIEGFCATAKDEIVRLRAIAAWLSSGSKTDGDRGVRLADAIAAPENDAAFALFRQAVLNKDGTQPKRLVTNGLVAKNSGHAQYFGEFADRVFASEMRRRMARAAELSHATLVIADAVRDSYAEMKRVRGVLDYDDLIVETKALLERSDAAQWILFKLDGGIDHILIDEAQDTSPEQWTIVSRLTEEFFAGSSTRGERHVRTIFAVGDEKQSIFSFQGAEPEQFEKHRDYFEKQAEAAEREFVNEPLATSRRSAPQILDFVDEVFRNPEARDGLGTALEIKHHAHRAKAIGRVEFWPAIKPLDEPEPDPRREVDRPSEASPAARLAERVATQIATWIKNRVRLPDHEKPIQPGDIMILLPRREPFSSLIIRALKDRGIPVAGADRMYLTSQIVVRDLLALGAFVLQPEDDLTTATLLRSPFCGLSDEQLLALCNGRAGRVWAELSARATEDPAFARAHDFLSSMLARADFTPPFEFYGHALTTWKMRARLVERLGPECEDAIDEFLALAFAYETANAPSLQGFVDWIERGGAEVKRDMERGRNEVRVMTVHGAKGLEADIVFLPDTTSVPQTPTVKGHLNYTNEGVFFPIPKEQQTGKIAAVKGAAYEAIMREHRRLLYVALTRARDRLYICGFENKTGIKDDSWYRLTEPAAEKLGTKLERDGETILVFGDANEQYSLDIEPQAARIPLPDWVSLAPDEPARPRLLRPYDAVEGVEPPANSPRGDQGAKRFARGLLVHTMLSRLPELAPDAREAAARRFLQTKQLEKTEIDALVAETLAVLNDEAFAAAFAPGSRAEVALTAELPELGAGARINGRIDRLAVGTQEILIVDYKTNRPPPETEDKVTPVYLAQMALYRAAAAKIFPGRRIACGLVWTDGPRLMRLSDERLDAQLAAIRARLDPGGPHT